MTQGVMRKCAACGEYTLKEACPHCAAKVLDPRPAKYSPEDHYGEYRRRLKRLTKGEGKA
jgi:H/ACA ribonucleoprotein complex subunit 3